MIRVTYIVEGKSHSLSCTHWEFYHWFLPRLHGMNATDITLHR